MANQFLIKETMEALRNLSASEIDGLKGDNPIYMGVKLLGYHQKGDTPAPIIYYLSPASPDPGPDDGGSIIAVGGIKLMHNFIGQVDCRYFGTVSNNETVDNSIFIQRAVDYAISGAPNRSLDIYLSGGTYTVRNGIDLSSNGWQGRIYGDGVGQYSTVLSADSSLPENAIHAVLFTRYVLKAGVAVDRFGRPFNANGNFELSNIVVRGGGKSFYEGNCPYTLTAATKYCVDFSSSSYIKISDCSFNRSRVGACLGKWHGRIERCNINLNEIGLELAQSNEYNTPSGITGNQYSLAMNNFTIETNNFINNKHHLKSPIGGYKITVTQNVFDKCSGSSLSFKNFDHISVRDNYFEGNNADNLGVEVDYFDINGVVKTEIILASNVFWSRSNYNSRLIHLDFGDNQCVNNTANTDNCFIALSGVNSYDIKNITFRGYPTGGVKFFGMGSTFNTTSSNNSRGIIDIDTLSDISKITYTTDIARKGLTGLTIYDRSNFQQIYLTGRQRLFDNDLQSFVQGDLSLAESARPTIIENNTSSFSKQSFRISAGPTKTLRAFYDYSNSIYKPTNIILDLSILPDPGELSVINFNIEIKLDNLVWCDELIGRYSPTAHVDKVFTLFNNTFYIGGNYNTLEIKLKPQSQKNITVSEFCIRESSLLPSFKDKQFFVENNGAKANVDNGNLLIGTLRSGTINQVTTSNKGNNFPTAFGSVLTFNGANFQRTFSIYTDNADNNKGLWIQLYNSIGMGLGWRNLLGEATASTLGLVKQANVSIDSASIPSATYIQAEAQATLMELRDLKTKLRDAGILTS